MADASEVICKNCGCQARYHGSPKCEYDFGSLGQRTNRTCQCTDFVPICLSVEAERSRADAAERRANKMFERVLEELREARNEA